MMNAWLKGKSQAHNAFSRDIVLQQPPVIDSSMQHSIERGYLTALKRTTEYGKAIASTLSREEAENIRRLANTRVKTA